MIYLDHAAITPPLPCAIDAMNSVLRESWGNPNSAHAIGGIARDALEQAKSKIAGCINAAPDEIFLCSGATEAAKWAIYSLVAEGYGVSRYDTEHNSVLGHSYLEQLVEQTRGAKGLAYARMLANNETGEIFPPPQREPDMPWLCDATAALGHIPVDVKKLDCDYLFGSAQKFGGIPGVGFLYVKDGSPLHPLIGADDEQRAGTPPVALISAMAAALEWNKAHMAENTKQVNRARMAFLGPVCNRRDIWINSKQELSGKHQIPHILNVSFDGVDGKTLALMLSMRGVMVSGGAACSSGDNEPSHVIRAMYGEELAKSAIRISFSHETTLDEAAQAARIIAECVDTLRKIS